MLDLTAFTIIIIALSLIVLILYKKLPLLQQIEVEEIYKEKNKKYKILEERLRRKIKGIAEQIKVIQSIGALKKMKGKLTGAYAAVQDKKTAYIAHFKKKKETDQNIAQEMDDQLENARSLIKEEKLKDAEKIALDFIKAHPTSLSAYKLLGEIFIHNKNFVHAEATMEHIIQLGGRLKKITAHDYIELAKTKMKLDKLEETLQAAKKAVLLEPLNPKILHFLTEICILCKQKELAWKYFKKLKSIDQDNQALEELLQKLKTLE